MTADFREFVDFLNRLEAARIYYTLCKERPDTVMIIAYVPGQHWEIEFTTDGEWEVEVFKSDGTILDKVSLDILLRDFGEPTTGPIVGKPYCREAAGRPRTPGTSQQE